MNPADNNEMIAAIAAVINGTSTGHERSLVENWLLEDEKNPEILKYFQRLGYTESLDKAYQSKDKIFNTVQGKIQQQGAKRQIRIWQYVAAASVAALLFIGGLHFFKPERSNVNNTAYVETKCLYATKSKIVLSDGTVVELNAGSVLKYPVSFSEKERVVMLSGEAYFEVSKNEKQAFIVKTSNIDVEVLGTHFNLKAYENDNKVVATLLEGSIRVERTNTLSGESQPVILTPNQQAVFDKNSNVLEVEKVNAPLFVAWKDGTYYFDNETFEDIAHKLERGFNVQINITSLKLRNELYSGIFDKGENLQQILNLFKKHRYFDYKQTDNIIEIYEK